MSFNMLYVSMIPIFSSAALPRDVGKAGYLSSYSALSNSYPSFVAFTWQLIVLFPPTTMALREDK